MQNFYTKILIISSEFPPNVGGIGNHAYHLAKSLCEQGFQVTATADLINVNKKTTSAFSALNNFVFHPISRKKIVWLTYLQRIQKAIYLSKKSDVIICSGKFSLQLIQILKPIYPRKKFITIVHGSEIAQLKSVEKILKKFNAIIPVSTFTKKLLPKILQQASNVFIIPNGIDLDDFSSCQAQQKKGINIITVGSVTERKGQENVINALPALLSAYPELNYQIVGKPVIELQLRKKIYQLHLQNHVTFHGMLERNKMLDLLKSSCVKFMLSNTTANDVEGFGIAILEANALGIPAIGSGNTGIEDAIDNGRTGFIVDAKNTKEIVEAFSKIMNNYNFFSANAIQWAKEHDWKIIVKKYVEVIEKLSPSC